MAKKVIKTPQKTFSIKKYLPQILDLLPYLTNLTRTKQSSFERTNKKLNNYNIEVPIASEKRRK